MMSTIKSKKSALPVDKKSTTRSHRNKFLAEIPNPSQDVQLRDLKGENAKTNPSLDEAGARIRENEKKL